MFSLFIYINLNDSDSIGAKRSLLHEFSQVDYKVYKIVH